jgi:hypothetical protein
MESAMAMKMAVESMEMAPGAIPHPDRVPEICLRWRRRDGGGAAELFVDGGLMISGFHVRGNI